jgi:glycosyltransferase involved in cell wall biosynthesis
VINTSSYFSESTPSTREFIRLGERDSKMIVAGIPAYNEENSIAKVVMLAQKYVDLVIVCDDGSQDLTSDIAQKLGALVIKHEENLGYGAALQTLFDKARALNADLLLTLDADGQHDPSEIPEIIQPILEGKADIVIGSRFLRKNHMPTYRRFGIKVLTKITNGSSDKGKVTDAQCGFRAYNRKAIEGLMLDETGMGISAESLRKARALGFVVTEVSVDVRYEGLKTSTHNPLAHGLGVISTIIRMIVEERPLTYLGLPGAALLALGAVFGLWTLQIFASNRYIATNIALASLAFTMIGIFCVFTAITLYAILRAIAKRTK